MFETVCLCLLFLIGICCYLLLKKTVIFNVKSLGIFLFGFRFAGQTEWFRPDAKGRFSYDFMNFPNAMIEEVDLSGTPINSDGLDNLGNTAPAHLLAIHIQHLTRIRMTRH